MQIDDNWLFILGGDRLITQRTIKLATIMLLSLGFMFTSSSAFAYWKQATVTRDVEIVSIGEPIQIIVNDISDDLGTISLVPEGYVISTTDVDNVEFQYTVGVSRELLNSVNLNITADNILINNDDMYSNLVDINVMGMGQTAVLDLYNDTITITVTVRLLEPIDQEEAISKGLDNSLVNVEDSVLAYNTIKGKTISFNLNFSLSSISNLSNSD
jgi:hypothetical protein